MRTAKHRRLARVGLAIDATPLRGDLVRRAFARFRETGELPDEKAVANAVIRWALFGEEAAQADRGPRQTRSGPDLEVVILATACGDQPPPPPPMPSLRECLFGEAVHGAEPVRRMARLALTHLVDAGADVTDRQLLADRQPPKFGSVGAMVLGYPDFLATSPFKAQARRLFARYSALLDRVHDDEADGWIEDVVHATVRFYESGELPRDDLLRLGVLDSLEFNALWEHRRGCDVRELMAALDAVARAAPAERDAVIERLRRLVREAPDETQP